MQKTSSFIIILALATTATAQKVKRIKSIAFDKSKVEKIYIAQGLSTIVSFNCSIAEMITGNKEQVTLEGLQTDKKQMKITLAKSAAQPTNIFVKCGQRTVPYIFDIIPSKNNHQDYLQINLNYGEPEYEKETESDVKPIPKKKRPSVIEVKPLEKIEIQNPKTIEEKFKQKESNKIEEPERERLKDVLKEEVKDEKKPNNN